MPGTNQLHLNALLTDVSVKYIPPDLAADKVLRPIRVQHLSDEFPIWDRVLFDLMDDTRANGAPSRQTDAGFKLTSYQCVEHSLHALITESDLRNADDVLDIEMVKTETVKQQVLNNYENLIFGSGGFATNTANFINSRAYGGNGSALCDLSNASTGSPRALIDAMKEDVEVASGRTPNTIIGAPASFRAIMRTEEFRKEEYYQSPLQGTANDVEDLPQKFYGMDVVPVKALLNSANKGQPRSLARVAGKNFIVAYIAPGGLGRNMLTWAVRLWTEEYVSKWYEPDIRSWKIEYGRFTTPKLIAAECASLATLNY